jgi:putative ABC transport system permease protein
MSWALAARFARRELRSGLAGFRVFLACLLLGVAAIAAVGTLSASITEGLRRDARVLNGGDIAVALSQRPASESELAALKASGRVSEFLEMRAMARAPSDANHGDETRSLVELKAVDGHYPLAGRVELENGVALPNALGAQGGVANIAVERSLLAKLDRAVGDVIEIGDASFRIAGVIAREPDKIASVMSFGPRVMMSAEALAATHLVQPGSQIRYQYNIDVPREVSVAGAAKALETDFPQAGWRIRTTDEAAPGIRRFVDQLTLFLTFVGLTTLLVGGVGVSNAVAAYLDGRMKTIAMLKCLGASSQFIFRVYILQMLALSGIGLFIGVAVGAILPPMAIQFAGDLLPIQPVNGIYPIPLLAAAAYGLLIALTFALWPLACARRISAVNIFRVFDVQAGWPPLRDLAPIVLSGSALATLTVATATNRWFAIWFVIGALASFGLLSGAARVLKTFARHLHAAGSVTLRLALANLHRPGATTTGVVLSLGLGLSVLVAIVLIESNITRQIENRLSEGAPAFFFLDIQPDQVGAFDRTVTDTPGISGYKRVASLRGRIVAIKGVPVDQAPIATDAEWAVRGDRALSYSANPPDGARIVAGSWWPSDYIGPPLISMDADVAKGFGVGIGDNLTLNVLGRDIVARVASLREIDWRSLRFDFAIILSPGVLEAAPRTHVAAVSVPVSGEEPMERAIAKSFVNVSVVRVRDALEQARELLAGINIAIGVTSAITLAAGALVLAGAVAAGRRRRISDAVVFKVLGATRATILRAFLLEYGVLGLATGAISAMVGTLVAWAISKWLMNLAWSFDAAAVAATIGATTALALLAGFAGTWRALVQKAAPLLRNE